MGYENDARDDAAETAENFIDDIVERLADDEPASIDLLNDYPGGDAWHHESHVDKAYNLTEAAGLLKELSEYEETDEGLWQGLKPKDAIGAQAAYTYGNAVYAMFQELVERINDEHEMCMDDLDQWSKTWTGRWAARQTSLSQRDELDDEEHAELVALQEASTTEKDDEDTMTMARKARIKVMVERVIADWRK